MRRPLVAATIGAAAALLLVVLVGLPLALTHRSELPLERRYASFAVSAVVALAAGDAKNPAGDDARAMAAGRAAYTGSCAICHGAEGDGRGRFGSSTYPPAADLRAGTVRARTDAQLFWIVKHGLSFTAMPAFADVYDDGEIWSIVTYLRALQRGSTRALDVAPPAAADLALADPRGSAIARGAAIYLAQGCHLCHGTADAPEGMSLRRRAGTHAIRAENPAGMPLFGVDRISEEDLADLEAFLVARFAN
ncbi:MAG TPA: c-type cytochrome [Candidatus Limnocylindria bacterium]|nr:c-type cytochrome [Candidatus Limnocylindria bacterium]